MTGDELAARVRRGVEALKGARPAEAVEALEPVAGDAGFMEAPDLADVRARVWSLLAQALHDAGRSREAEPWARKAIGAAEQQGDREGATEVRLLHRAIFSAATETARVERAVRDAKKLAALSIEEVLAGSPGAAELIAKANADLDDARPEDGARAAGLALERADDPRDVVLAHLTLARAMPSEARRHLDAAWRAADASADHNLVTAVARAADVAGVQLAVLYGPGGTGG